VKLQELEAYNAFMASSEQERVAFIGSQIAQAREALVTFASAVSSVVDSPDLARLLPRHARCNMEDALARARRELAVIDGSWSAVS
jgi:hypothetical protein